MNSGNGKKIRCQKMSSTGQKMSDILLGNAGEEQRVITNSSRTTKDRNSKDLTEAEEIKKR